MPQNGEEIDRLETGVYLMSIFKSSCLRSRLVCCLLPNKTTAAGQD